MPKLILALFLLFVFTTRAESQNIYNFIIENARQTVNNPGSSFSRKQIEQFKLNALEYIKQMLPNENNKAASDSLLDTQAYYLSEFTMLYFSKVLEDSQTNSNKRKKNIEIFAQASLQNPLFRNADAKNTQSGINEKNELTPFSLNTDWERALKAVVKKKHLKQYQHPNRKAPKYYALREKVWNAWIDSLKAAEKQKLPALLPLSPEMSSHKLEIPDSLEPNAVMDYYWGFKADSTKSENNVPTFIYLHGSGPRDAEWNTGMLWANRFADAPCNYFIPRIPNEGKYYRWWQTSKQWAWEWLWKQLLINDDVDINRIIVFGISEGGYGSQRLAAYYADYLAGAGPMAGGEPLINAPCENLQHISFSLLTGEKDYMFCRNVYTQLAAMQLDSLQALSEQTQNMARKPLITEQASPGSHYHHRVGWIKGAGHGFDYRPTTPWLRNSHRNATPKSFVWEDFEMDGKHRKGFYNIRVDKRPCDSLRTRYDVDINHDGEIHIKIQNIHYIPLEKEPNWGLTLRWEKEYTPAQGGKLTIFLDERYVDLSKKVTVFVNGKKMLSKKPKVSEAAMKAAIQTYADPKRVFVASFSVEY